MTITSPNTAPDPALEHAFQACRAITRENARNFYYGLRLTPEPRRSAVYAIYAWMRLADDEADARTDLDTRRERLRAFSDRSRAVLAGSPPADGAPHAEVWKAFAHTLSSYPIEHQDLLQLLVGLERDLQAEQALNAALPPVAVNRSRAELESYCYCVASVVGMICIDIWGLRPGADRARARTLAAQRGLAFQLTNILRDYAQDYDAGRVYLPADDFSRHALTPAQLRNLSDAGACRAMITDLAAWAERSYLESAGLESMIDPACSPTLWTMTRIYARLLEKIQADPLEVCTGRRVRVRTLRKAGIVLKAMIKAGTHAWA